MAALCKLSFALRQACPKKIEIAPKRLKPEEQKKAVLAPYSSPTDAMKAGVGRNSVSSTSAPSSSASTLLSSSRSLRSRSSHSDASLCASSQARAGASLPTSVVERKSSTALLHLSSASRSRTFQRLFHLPISFLTSTHRSFCWPLQAAHTLKRWSLVSVVHGHHPLGGESVLRPIQVFTSEAVACFQLVKPGGVPLGATATVSSGFCLAGILYFFLEVRPPAHWRSSAHLFSEISRLRYERDLGSGIRDPPCNHSTPRASGSSSASFAHSPAFSLSGTPLSAGPIGSRC